MDEGRTPPGAPPAETPPPAPDPAVERSERVRARALRLFWRRVLRRAVLVVSLVTVVAVVGLSQTGEGQEVVLDITLDRIRNALAGEILIGGIRSGTLFTGATLTDVRLTASDGRRFLDADSVVVRYSLASVLTGGTPIRSTTFWGVDVEISRYTADDVLNVTRLLAESEPDSVDATRDGPIELGRIGIRNGTARVLTPARPGSSAPTIVRPDGSRLTQLLFRDLDLDLEETVLRPGGAVELSARLASLSASVYVVDEPLELREVFGEVTYGAQGIRIQDAAFRLPSSLVRGDLTVGPVRPGADWTVRASVESDGWGQLDDIAWVDERIPPGRFRGGADISVPGDVLEVDFHDVEVQLEASQIRADGWVRFGDELAMRSLRLETSPLLVDRLEPWLGRELPLDGFLSGQATFSGTLTDLTATGRVTLVPTGYGGNVTTADFDGTIHRGENPGATGLHLELFPFDYTVLEAVWPGTPVAGPGSATIEIDGRADDGMAITADLRHTSDPGGDSRVRLSGLARRLVDGEWVTDMRGELAPLAIGALGRAAPALSLRGTLAGPIGLSGRLDELDVTGDLVTEGGGVVVDATVNLRDPGAAYRLEADGDDLPLSSLVAEVPEPSWWTGRLELHGRGLDLDSMEAEGTLTARASRIGPLRVDTVSAAVRITEGVLLADTLQAEVGGVALAGRGGLGLAPGARGDARFDFESEDLVGLRQLVMGVPDTVLVRDRLDDLDRQFLRASGVDPDTLPAELDVRMTGAVDGQVRVSGEVRAFDLDLIMDVVGGAYQHNQVDSATVGLTATALPGTSGTFGLGMSASGVVWQGRAFQQGGFEAEMTERIGTGRIELVRTATEKYGAVGGFEIGDGEGTIALENAQVQVDSDLWSLSRAVTVQWDRQSFTVDSLRVDRGGTDPMWMSAAGTVARGDGSSDFRVTVDGLHVDRIVHVGQFRDLDVGGHVDMDLVVRGPAADPRIEGRFRIDGPRYEAMELTRLDGSLEYAERIASFSLQGWDGGRDALHARGELPLDLSMTSVETRVPDLPMDLSITADSLDAAIALSYLTSLEQVIGTVTGDVRIRGTPSAPVPEGRLVLSDAEWTIEAIGVRHGEVGGSVTLNPDRTADIELTSQGIGYSSVEGSVTLDPFSDPPLDLTFTFDRFQAVDRADVEGLISGEVHLGGRYRRPVATGSLTVDEANVYVDEFQRVAEVVDLTDPLLYETGFGVDTTALVAQPLVAGLRNPFFDNLRVAVTLAVPRDTWLRSIQTNVEIQGDLQVAYDRSAADLVLIGELEAVRGSHLVLGRNFEVDGGTVAFIGRPGMNPDLSIDASARVLRHQDDDLEVSAHVGGTLIQPIVTLSTNEVAISEADIVSYLIFGQASSELGSSQSALFAGLSRNSAAVSTAGTGILTYASGALANQFGAVLAQTGLLDYVSVQVLGTEGPVVNQIAGRTHLEAGRYLGEDVFVVLVFRTPRDGSDSNPFGGARVEWEPLEDYHVEAFYEDRFLRSGAAGFALPSLLDDPRVVGVFIFRDWGL